MGAIRLDTIISRRDDLLTQNLHGAVVMADLETGEYYGLDSTAEHVWKLLERSRTVSELCAHIQQSYAVDPVTCEADILNFLNDLLTRSLIRILPKLD